MTTILATLIFLLADGSPAKAAYVSCTGIDVFTAGDDAQVTIEEGSPLILDSRGAVQLITEQPRTIACHARQTDFVWQGDIRLARHGQITRLYLQKES